MQNFSFKTSRGEILKGMMRRPETAKLIKEALASPVGSTSRVKARKIFSIMNKLHSSHDGMGGPGMMSMYGQMPMQNTSTTQTPTETAKGMVVFHKIPKPKIIYGKRSKGNINDGSGGPGIYDGKGGLFDGLGNLLKSFVTPFTDSTNNSSRIGSSINLTPSSFTATPRPTTPSVALPQIPDKQIGPYGLTGGKITYSSPTSPSSSTPSTFSGLVSSVGVPKTTTQQTQTGFTPYVPPTTSTSKTPATSAWPALGGKTTGITSTSPGENLAAKNIASILKIDIKTPPANIPIRDFAIAIAQNEGAISGASARAVANNNPGNLKFANQPGATQDEKGFAKFATVDDGWNALQNDLQAKISRGEYATLNDLMNVYSPNSDNPAFTGVDTGTTGEQETPTPKYTGLAAKAKEAVDLGTGAGQFAIENNPLLSGTSLQKSIWDKYKIGEQQDEINRMRKEGAELPKNIAAYITARDEYITNTDKEIDRFINESMTTSDMSNPANAAKANAQLNYLYTLRGRQNQSYIGYLNDAVEQHQADLDNIVTKYNTAITAYEEDIKAGTVDYNNMATALSDLYTSLQDAPTRALNTQYLEAQILGANAKAAADAAKAVDQSSWLTQYETLKKADFVDSNGLVKPGTDLIQSITQYAIDNPEITPQNIIRTYVQGVNSYLNSTEDKNATTDKGITPDSKVRMAKEAIAQLKMLEAASVDNPTTADSARSAAEDVAQYIAEKQSESIVANGSAPKMMEAIKTLGPEGWFGNKKPPTEAQFIKTFTEKTGNPLDESLAKAIYATFLRFVKDAGDTTNSAVEAKNTFLYPSYTTTGWTGGTPFDLKNPFTPEQFAQLIANIYAESVLNSTGNL
jgi:hypothetical protein